MAPALLLALAAAQTMSAEEAIETQRAELRRVMRIDCPPGADEDIVVCGRGGGAGPRDYRVPYVPIPGRVGRLPGEAPTGMDALNADLNSRCGTVGRDQSCGSFDFLGAGIRIIREIIAGIERRRD